MAIVKKHKRPPACTECRRKKIGCDRAQPECANCLKTGRFKCQYPTTVGGIVVPSGIKNNVNNMQINGNYSQQFQRQINVNGVTPTSVPRNRSTNSIISNNTSSPNLMNLNSTLRLKNYNNQMKEYYGASNINGSSISSNRNNSTKSMRKMIDQINRQSYNGTNINDLKGKLNNINNYSNNQANQIVYRSSTIDDENEILNQLVNNYSEQDFSAYDNIDISNRINLLNYNTNNTPEVMNPYEFNNIYRMIPNGDESKININFFEDNHDFIHEFDKNNDILFSNFSQDEILLQEMEFLKERFKELQHYRQKNLLNDKRLKLNRPLDNQKHVDGFRVNKNDRFSSSDKNNVIDSRKENRPNSMLSVNSQFILFNPQENPVDLMKYFHNDTNQNNSSSLNYILRLKQNFKFNIKSIIYYDKFIFKFYQDLINLMDKKFPITNINKERQAQRLPVLNNKNNFNKIKILNFDHLNIILTKFKENLVNDLTQLLPILDFKIHDWRNQLNEILSIIQKDLGSTEIENELAASLVSIKKFNDKQLSFLGIFIIVTILTYLNLHTTSNILLKRNMEPIYNEIRLHLPVLHESLLYIQNKFIETTNLNSHNANETKTNIENNIHKLRYLAILQWYCNNFKQSMELINLFFHTDNDVDIKFAEKIKFNLVKDNNEIIKIWQFIEKNYIQKKLFNGQYPILVNDKIFSNSILNNDLINYDLDITKKELKLMEYLFNRQNFNINEFYYQLSMLEKSYNKLNQRDKKHHADFNNQNTNYIGMINENVLFYNEQVYYQINLFVRFYLLLQLEQIYHMENYQLEFNKLLEDFVTPILLKQFKFLKGKSLSQENGRENKTNYQYLFIDKTLSIIGNVIDILFAVYERIDQAYSLQKDINNNNSDSMELKQLNLILQTMTQLFVIISITLNKMNGINKPVLIVINKLKIYLSYMIKRNMRHINDGSFITAGGGTMNNGVNNAKNNNINAFNNLHITQITDIQFKIHNLLNQSISILQIESNELKEFVKENIISKEILDYNINNRNFKNVYEAFFM